MPVAQVHDQSGCRGTPLHHSPGVDAVHAVAGERADAFVGQAEEGSLLVVADAGRLDIGIQIRLQIMMRGISWRLIVYHS